MHICPGSFEHWLNSLGQHLQTDYGLSTHLLMIKTSILRLDISPIHRDSPCVYMLQARTE